MSKQCFKCLETKPLSEFYRHPRMGDGHLGKCKECTKTDVADRISRVKLDPEWVEMERERCRLKSETSRRLGKAYTPPSWDHNASNQTKKTAKTKLGNAVRDGIIIKPETCNRCGRNPGRRWLHGHHHNYSLPLAVEWLCSICHGLLHRKYQ